MSEHTLSHQESLRTIKEMLAQSRSNFKDGVPFYLLWGWAVLIAAAFQYLFLVVWPWRYASLIWLPAILTGIVGSVIIGRQKGKKQTVTTFIDNAMKYVWSGFAVMLFIILSSAYLIGWPVAYMLLIGLYGLGTFISGGILKFKPLVWGGAGSWVLAMAGLFGGFVVNNGANALLMLIASIIISYLIPGYLLKQAYR